MCLTVSKAAEVLSASGSRATFKVPALAGPGRVLVRASNPGGQTGSIPLDVDFDGHVAISPDPTRSVGGDVGSSGGTIRGEGFRLTVPPGALGETHHIAITPIALQGSPFDHSLIVGARFSPDGLRFLRPASLTMTLPAGISPEDVLGFGGNGSGTDVHLLPRFISGNEITVLLSHFSIAGASSGGASAAQAAATFVPRTPQETAEQLIASAIINFPSIAGQLIALHLDAWFQSSVGPNLIAAYDKDTAGFEQAASEWLAWESLVERYGDESTGDGETVADHLSADEKTAKTQATLDGASTADMLLARCTGFTDLTQPIHDIVELDADLGWLALPIESAHLLNGHVVPPAGALAPACAHVEIQQVTHPEAFAVDRDNTIDAHFVVKFANGPARTDLPVSVALLDSTNGSPIPRDSATIGDGHWRTVIRPRDLGQVLLTLRANLQLGEANHVDLGNSERIDVEVRHRIDVQAAGPAGFADAIGPIYTGDHAALRVRVAGDGMSGASVTQAVESGPGSLSAPGGVSDAHGVALFTFTSNDPGTATISATSDGTSDSDSITIEVRRKVSVTVSPSPVSVAPGGQVQFSATVANAANAAVTWTQIGGSITTGGLYTAGPATGTFGVTATSVEDASAKDTVTVEIKNAGRWVGSAHSNIDQSTSTSFCTPSFCVFRDGFEHDSWTVDARIGPGGELIPGGTFSVSSRDHSFGSNGDCSSIVSTEGTGVVDSVTITASRVLIGATATVTRTTIIGSCGGQPGVTERQTKTEHELIASQGTVTNAFSAGALVGVTWALALNDGATSTLYDIGGSLNLR